MLWLEMSRDQAHGGASWGFTHSLWSPTRKLKKDGSLGGRWPCWDNLLKVRTGDLVLHLRDNQDGLGAFVGYSTAETDGFETFEHPPNPGSWGYSESFYRVLLKDFSPFPGPIQLSDVFSAQEKALRAYIERNKNQLQNQRRHIFCVIQGERLQRFNGGYLTEVDEELEGILLGSESKAGVTTAHPFFIDVKTGERIQELKARVGQRRFSDEVHTNYGNRCCFPGCIVAEEQFLVGSHIARWADVPELRGRLDNGICLCLMHDKAFELGLFTIDKNLYILVPPNEEIAKQSKWYQARLLPYNGQPIRRGAILPSVEALQHHWKRVGISF